MTEAKILRDVEHPYVVNCLHAFKVRLSCPLPISVVPVAQSTFQ